MVIGDLMVKIVGEAEGAAYYQLFHNMEKIVDFLQHFMVPVLKSAKVVQVVFQINNF